MEIFMGRCGFRFVRGSFNISRNFVGFNARFYPPRLGSSLFDKTNDGLSLVDRIAVKNFNNLQTPSNNLCNRCGLIQRRLYSDNVKKDATTVVASSSTTTTETTETKTAKQNIFQKMKQMTKDYWHVLIPVHVVTSIGWLLIFYTAAKNSVDVIWIMERLHFSEKYIEALRGSSAGFWAVTYALYKIFTPLRYMITVGGTTLAIRYLNKMGYTKFQLRRSPAIKKSQPLDAASKNRQTQTDPPKT